MMANSTPVLRHGEFEYRVLPNGGRRWLWAVFHPAAGEDPLRQGEFRGSEGRAHVVAREEIARLRESRIRLTRPSLQQTAA